LYYSYSKEEIRKAAEQFGYELMKCVKCDSENINSYDDVFICRDCGYRWKIIFDKDKGVK